MKLTLYHLFSCPILTLSYWANLCSSAQSTKSIRSVALKWIIEVHFGLGLMKLTELVWSSNTCFVDRPSNLHGYFRNHLKIYSNYRGKEIIRTFISFPVSVKRYFTIQSSLNNSPSTTISFLIAPDFKPYFWRWSNSINTWCSESSLIQLSTMFGTFHWNYFESCCRNYTDCVTRDAMSNEEKR